MINRKAIVRGGRVTKWKGCVASIAPYALFASVSIAALGALPAQAETVTDPNRTSTYDFYDYNENLTFSGAAEIDIYDASGGSNTALYIDIDGLDYSADLTNHGTFDVTVVGTNGSASDFDNDFQGFTGFASASASAFASTGDPGAYGIIFDGGLSGSLTNSGDIGVQAIGGYTADAYAYASAGAGPAAIANAAAYATAEAGNPLAVGIYIDTSLTGRLANEGSLSVYSTGGDTAYAAAYASVAAGNATSVAAFAKVGAYAGNASATGLYVSEVLSGHVTNSGSIDVGATGGDNARAYASLNTSDLYASYASVGTASGVAIAAAGNAYAAGIAAGESLTGSVTNSGTITVTASGGSYSTAYASIDDVSGFYVTDMNAYAKVTAEAGNAEASGIVSGLDVQAVTNSGSITVIANGGTSANATALTSGVDITNADRANGGAYANAFAGNADAAAVRAVGDVGSLVNSGTLTVIANGGSEAYALADMSSVSVNNYWTTFDDGTAFHTNFGIFGNAEQYAVARAGNAAAYGVVAGVDVANLANSGVIDVTANGGYSAFASAQADEVDVTRVVDANATGVAMAYAGNALAHGVSAGQDIGVLTNSGSINVTAQGGYDAGASASATQASIDTVYQTARAEVVAGAFAGNAEGVGIHAGEDLLSSLVNSGSIAVTATGGDSARAEVDVSSASIDSAFYGYAYSSGVASAGNADARGVGIGENLLGDLTNSGSITVTANGGSSAAAYVSADDMSINDVEYAFGTVQMRAYAGNAYAAGVSVGNDLRGTLSNSGVITVTSNGGADAFASASLSSIDISNFVDDYGSSAVGRAFGLASAGNADANGIAIGTDLTGALSNTGTISVTANGGYSAEADVNSGESISISQASYASAYVSFVADAGNANASGIDVGQNLTGSLVNSGLITVTANGGDDASATATHTDVSVTSAYAGFASAVGQAFAGNASAYGIRVGNDLTGSLVNSGTINVTANGGDGGNATATMTSISVSDVDYGTAIARASAFAGNAYANGISIGRDLTSDESLHNTGTIIVRANGGTGNYAYADASATVTDSIDESATATAIAVAGAGNAYATGVGIGRDMTGSLTNSGVIDVAAVGGNGNRAEADADADADADWSSDENSSSLDTAGMAVATGIGVGGEMNGALSNTGLITVTATGGQDNGTTLDSNYMADAYAYGIHIGDRDGESGGMTDGGVLTHSGVIMASAEAFDNADAEAYGIRVEDVAEGSRVVVDGKIVARVLDVDNPGQTVADDAYAIWLGDGRGDLEISNPAFFEGRLSVEDHNVNLTSGPGTSVNWTFDDRDEFEGVFTLDGSLPWYVKNGGSSNPSYATYDPTGLAAQSNILSDLAGNVSRLGQYGLSKAGPARNVVPTADVPGSYGDLHFWMTGMNSQRSYGGDGETTLDHDIASNAVAMGASFEYDTDLLVSVLGGYNWGKMDEANGKYAATGDIETTGGFAGIYARYTQDMFALGGGLAGGIFSQDNTRTVNNNLVWGGIEELDSDTDGYWFSPELSASMNFDLSDVIALRPTVTGRYILGSINGYSEGGGSDSVAEVGDQDVSVFEVDANAMMDFNTGFGVLSVGGGYLFRSDNSDSEVDVTIFGVTQGMPVSSTDGSAPYAQAGYTLNMMDSLALDINGRVLLPEDGEMGTDVMAKLKFSF